MKATIFIRGIGMIHEKDGAWGILFPFDDCHTVKFSTGEDDEGSEAISLAPSAREVRVQAVNPESVFRAGEGFEEFLDITSNVAHKDGVKLKTDDDLPFILLKIENAEFSIASHTFCRYQLLSGSNVLTEPKAIAYSGKAEIIAESIVIDAAGVEGFPKTFDQDIEILFDNICPPSMALISNAEPVSDLNLLYNVVEDVTEPGKKLIIDRDPSQKPGSIVLEPGFGGIGLGDLDNVLPGQKGLPCNMVKATKFG